MDKKSLILKSIIFVPISCIICVLVIHTSLSALNHHYVYNSNTVSSATIEKIIYENYPDAYTPYKNLDSLIGDYKNIKHIYELNFTQRMPLYIYVVSTNNLVSTTNFLVIFNDNSYIEDIIFLNENKALSKKTYLNNDYISSLLKNEYANNLDLDNIISKNQIIKGIQNAALNLIYEVK